MRALKNKVIVTVATGVVVVGGASAAYAYWSTSGSGSGSAASSDGASNLAIAQTSTLNGMYPGDSPQTISGSVTNNATSSAYVAKVTVSISSVTQAASASGECTAADYTLANPDMTVARDLASKGSATFSGATIKFNDSSTSNQDGCKGATVNLAYAAS